MANLLAKNSTDRGFDEALMERDISYTVEPYNELLGFSVTYSNYYQYEIEGIKRHAYEVNIRTAIDDYEIVSVIFDAPATRDEIVQAVNGQ